MSLVLAILGIIWTILSSIMWIMEIVNLCTVVRYGGIVTSRQLWGIGFSGTGIFLFVMALFPYVKPLIQLALQALLNAIGGGTLVPVANKALDVASDAAQSATSAVVGAGKTVAAEIAERLPAAANNILPAAGPQKLELVWPTEPLRVVTTETQPAATPKPATPAPEAAK